MLGKSIKLGVLCLAYNLNSSAQSDIHKSDTIFENVHIVTYEDCKFTPKHLIVPAALTFLGVSGLIHESPLNALSEKMQNSIEKHNVKAGKEFHTDIDSYIQYAPLAIHIGLGLTGVKAKHTFIDRTMAAATAYGFMAILNNGMKYTIGEKRPDCNTHNSFPSGHTATAFTGAELVRIEYGDGYGTAAYCIAALTGGLRILNNRHWLQDVVAGAGIGILCAKAGYWMLPVWKRTFKFKAKSAKGNLTPYINLNSNEYAMNLFIAY